MKTDWKALCQELLIDYEQHLYRSVLADRARAALAAEPVVEGPTDEEVEAWADQQGFVRGHADLPFGFWIDYVDVGALVRAALSRWGSCQASLDSSAPESAADGPAVQSREPASVVGEPSDEELLGIAAQAIEPYDKISLGKYEAENNCAIEVYTSELIAFARAVLARYGHQPAPPAEGEVGKDADVRRMCEIILGNTFGNKELDSLALLVGHHPDVLNASTVPVSSPLPVAAGEVGELVEFLRVWATLCPPTDKPSKFTRAAELLEQRHPTPVPVSKRLPGPGDCDEEGLCWWFSPADPSAGTFGVAACWVLRKHEPEDNFRTHWLSCPSLPLPDQE